MPEIKIISRERLHISPSYIKESMTKLKHIESLLERMVPHIERMRRVNKAWIENYGIDNKRI